MVTTQLIQLFNTYRQAFQNYDLSSMITCYSLPCALHTPDQLAYITNLAEFEHVFIDIFTVLKQGGMQTIRANKASYAQIDEHFYNVCIDWDFIDGKGQIFADFSAFYHITWQNEQFKIVNVISHDLSNSVTLTHNLIPDDINALVLHK